MQLFSEEKKNFFFDKLDEKIFKLKIYKNTHVGGRNFIFANAICFVQCIKVSLMKRK